MKYITIGMIIILSVIIVIIGSDFYLLWLPLEHSPEYPAKVAALFMAVTALVTLFLALATFNATEQSNLREQEHRRDEIDRENRDRKERLLNEIIEWAIDVPTYGVKEYSNFAALIDNPRMLKMYFRNILLGCRALNIKGEHIRIISHSFNDELDNVVQELGKGLGDYIEYLEKSMDKANLDEDWGERKKLSEYTIKVLNEANKIKTVL
ncbi:MAG: hypothetical protein Q8O55_09350 [Dehalococcoidales bacterium]|nr:hypothetical protein [Dehalococcoidales bacterium]